MSFPHYYQPDSMDFGPTCLRMVAKHYKRDIALQYLREKTGIGKEGVNLLGISEAAVKYLVKKPGGHKLFVCKQKVKEPGTTTRADW